MLELILIRHGETDSNKRGTYLGWTDVELNENGLRQAIKLRDRLKGTKVDGIYSSPLKRTMKTAEIINENYNLDINYTEALKERNFGIWEDLTHKELRERYPTEYSDWLSDWVKYRIMDGETALESYERVTAFIKELLKSKGEGKFVVVTHLGAMRFMLSYLLGMNIEDSWCFRVDNGSLSRVEIQDGHSVLTKLNEC